MDGDGQDAEVTAAGESAASNGGEEYGRQKEKELLVHPWIGLLARAGDFLSEAAVGSAFSQFNPKQVVIFEAGKERFSVAALVFERSLQGYQDGFAFERCFLDKGRQRKEWRRAIEAGSSAVGSPYYGWLAGPEDFHKEDEVGGFLFQQGELKCVSMVPEEQFLKAERRQDFYAQESAEQKALETKNGEVGAVKADFAQGILLAAQEVERSKVEVAASKEDVKVDLCCQILEARREEWELRAEPGGKTEELSAVKDFAKRWMLEATQGVREDAETWHQKLETRSEVDILEREDSAQLIWTLESLKHEIHTIGKEKQHLRMQLEEQNGNREAVPASPEVRDLRAQLEASNLQVQILNVDLEAKSVQVQKLTAELEAEIEEVEDTARASLKQSLEFLLIQSGHDMQLKELGKKLAEKSGELEARNSGAPQLPYHVQTDADVSVQTLCMELMLWAKELNQRSVAVDALRCELEKVQEQNRALRLELDKLNKCVAGSKVCVEGVKQAEQTHVSSQLVLHPPSLKLGRKRPQNGWVSQSTSEGPIDCTKIHVERMSYKAGRWARQSVSSPAKERSKTNSLGSQAQNLSRRTNHKPTVAQGEAEVCRNKKKRSRKK